MAIQDLTTAFKRGAGRFLAEYRGARVLQSCSNFRRIQATSIEIENVYYFTSERGLFRLEPDGLYQILEQPLYGIAIGGEWVFLTLFCHDYSIVVRGNRRALEESGRGFEFKEIYRLQTLSTNERIHGVFFGSGAVWVANTGRNTLLKIDPEGGCVTAELAVFLDRFDRPVLYNNNHLNSVSEYSGVVLFVAYRAGDCSLIGVTDGVSVTGYCYPRVGVHDIYLNTEGLVFCDTFGANTLTEGGAMITNAGVFDAAFFSRPPGCIVRGVTGSADELLIGHSHKGTRASRFEGLGAILHAKNGKVVGQMTTPCAQIYQIISADGSLMGPTRSNIEIQTVKELMTGCFGDPVYQAKVATL